MMRVACATSKVAARGRVAIWWVSVGTWRERLLG